MSIIINSITQKLKYLINIINIVNIIFPCEEYLTNPNTFYNQLTGNSVI